MPNPGWAATVCTAALLAPAVAYAGDGTFPDSLRSDFQTGGSPEAIALGDFNSDGRQDFVTANRGSDTIRVRHGVGGGFSATSLDYSTGDGPKDVSVGDFNNDGHEDIATANSAGTVTVRLGTAGGTHSAQGTGSPIPAGTAPHSLVVFDFDRDGNDDIAVANHSGILVLEGLGNGGFLNGPSLTTSDPTQGDIVTGDFSSDGYQDLAIVTDRPRLALNSTADAFSLSRPLPTAPFGDGMAAGDFDDDMDQDLAVANSDVQNVEVLLGEGLDSAFPDGSSFSIGTDPYAIAAGDLDSDGDEDLVAPGLNTDDVRIRFGGSDGSFPSGRAAVVTAAGGPRDIAIGDFDADGNQDLAIVNVSANSVTIRRGAGTPPLAGNLLVNGGFEGASAAHEPDSPALPITGWSQTGTMTAARYGMRARATIPGRLEAPALSGGLNFLYGGPTGATSSASQTVDVSGSAASIDAGLASAHLSALLGGGSTFADHMTARGSFLDGAGSELGAVTLGPVTAAQRRNLSTLVPRSESAPVPAGTRSIRVTFTAVNFDSGGSSAFADNAKVTLDAPAPEESTTGGEDDSEITLELAGKKRQRVVKQGGVILSAECPLEPCTVEGTASGTASMKNGRAERRRIGLRPSSSELVPGVAGTLRFSAGKRQLRTIKAALSKGGKLKFVVRAQAVDARGNMASRKLSVAGRR